MAKPKYITDLETRMGTMESIQDDILKKTGEIHTALMGTKYDQAAGNGGGVVKRLVRIEKKCEVFQNWKTKLTATNTIIWIVLSGALCALWILIVNNWDILFNL